MFMTSSSSWVLRFGRTGSPTRRRRLADAVDLFKTGKGRYLIVTGGLGKHPPCEAQVMYQLARSAEVPAARIVLEEQALSTFDSTTYAKH